MRHYVDVTDADFERASAVLHSDDPGAVHKQLQIHYAMGVTRKPLPPVTKKPPFCKAPHLHATPRKTGVWRRRELNPRPAIFPRKLLRA